MGGGPAGMEASRVAALRGHEVILVEKENRWVIALSFLDKRIRNRGFVSYNKVLQNNFKKLGVKIITKKEADTNFVSTIKPVSYTHLTLPTNREV